MAVLSVYSDITLKQINMSKYKIIGENLTQEQVIKLYLFLIMQRIMLKKQFNTIQKFPTLPDIISEINLN